MVYSKYKVKYSKTGVILGTVQSINGKCIIK